MSQWPQYPQYGQQPQQWQGHYQQQHRGPLPHSKLGIVSFIISIAAVVLAFTMIIIAGIMESKTPGGLDEDSPEMMALGAGILLSPMLAMVGGILGIVGCCLPDRNKIFAILGIVFNALVILGVIGLMILGLAVE